MYDLNLILNNVISGDKRQIFRLFLYNSYIEEFSVFSSHFFTSLSNSEDCIPRLQVKREEGVSISVQTDPPRSPSPPPFYTEWEEGVRKSVWQPGYLPQPKPPGIFV